MARDFRARVMQALFENPRSTVNAIYAIVEDAAREVGREEQDISRYRAEFSALAREGKIVDDSPPGSERKLWHVAPGATWRPMKSLTAAYAALPAASPLVDDSHWPTRQAPEGMVEAAIESRPELERAWQAIPSLSS